MASVSVNINSKSYGIDCGEGQEARVRQLAKYIDERMRSLSGNTGAVSEDQLFVITSLVLADEVFDLREKAANSNGEAPSTEGYISEEELKAIVDKINTRIKSITKEIQSI
ncbi:MAG: cell division protein ZapA [Micavibrio sp.]|nr:cell division protein ZapA [Micavibrio sp.]|tara:strand:+ start:721 stop:1053 length:333 start_codon:yes stop_codon:yes gene_type:complete